MQQGRGVRALRTVAGDRTKKFQGCQNDKCTPKTEGEPGASGGDRDPVFLDLAVERGQPDVEETGGFGLITTGMVQHALDMQLFDTGKVEGRESTAGLGAGILKLYRQVIDV